MMEHHKLYITLAILPLILCVAAREWSVSYSPNLCALRGSSVEMSCSYTFPPNLTVTKAFWTVEARQDQADLTQDPAYAGRAQVDCGDQRSQKCTLRVTGVRPADARKYYCRIISQQEKQKWTGREGVTLAVTELRVTSPGHLREGKAVTLTCATNCSLSGSPQFVWRKNGHQRQQGSGSLYLGSLSPADEGSYTCAVNNLQSPPVAISILYSPRDVLVFVQPAGAILKGGTVTLTCISDANPPVDIYAWFKVNESTPVGSGLQYSLTNISSEDGGQYYCEARNGVGAGNSTAMDILIADECHCPLSVSVGVSIACGTTVLTCVFSFLIGYCCKKRGKSEDFVEESDDDSGNSDQQEDNDYESCQEDDNYENCQYGNAMQMDSTQERGEPYSFQDDDDDVYQNVDELGMG